MRLRCPIILPTHSSILKIVLLDKVIEITFLAGGGPGCVLFELFVAHEA